MPAFRHALLTSEKKRIVGVIAFVAFFAVLAAVRIFVLGSAMSRSGLVVSALVIAFELMLFRCGEPGVAFRRRSWQVSLVLQHCPSPVYS
jgi:hypothetical protein